MNIRDNDDDDSEKDASEIEREHFKRVKAQMAAEEEALKASRLVKGEDKKKYKKFSDKYVELELPDEEKLKIARRYQALNILMGFIGLGIIFYFMHNPELKLSLFNNFVIVFKIYSSTLHLYIFGNIFFLETNLILLGCTMVAISIAVVITLQFKHDRISDRINSGRSIKNRIKRAARKYHGLTVFIGVLGLLMTFLYLYYFRRYASFFDNFLIVLNIYDSTLYLSILESFVLKFNLALMGFALMAVSAKRMIGFMRRR